MYLNNSQVTGCKVTRGWIWVKVDREAGPYMCAGAWVVHVNWWVSWDIHGWWCMAG